MDEKAEKVLNNISNYYDGLSKLGRSINNVLLNLQNKYVIAGGSVVYGLLSDSDGKGKRNGKGKEPSDIDVFVLKSDKSKRDIIKDIYEIISREELEYDKWIIDLVYHCSDYCDDRCDYQCDHTFKTFSFHEPDMSFNIQIIFTDFNSVDGLIYDFDIDYVRCAIYKGRVYITPECERSHETQTIYTYKFNTRRHRFDKAEKKHFYLCPCPNTEGCNSLQINTGYGNKTKIIPNVSLLTLLKCLDE